MNAMARPPLHAERIPVLKPIRTKVADVTDAEQFPEIAEARRHAQAMRAAKLVEQG